MEKILTDTLAFVKAQQHEMDNLLVLIVMLTVWVGLLQMYLMWYIRRTREILEMNTKVIKQYCELLTNLIDN